MEIKNWILIVATACAFHLRLSALGVFLTPEVLAFWRTRLRVGDSLSVRASTRH